MSKQILVMRKFPKDRNMRTGKYVAQGAHASVGALLSLGSISEDNKNFVISLENPFVHSWVTGNFKKVACYVDTVEELIEIHKKAVAAGIATALITDAGLTEFGGVATLTAVGIGPDDDAKINKITGHLSLF